MDRYYKSNGLYVEEITIKQIRADVIDEFADILIKTFKPIEDEEQMELSVIIADIKLKAEQLKEQTE